jgi:hypothetical protein
MHPVSVRSSFPKTRINLTVIQLHIYRSMVDRRLLYTTFQCMTVDYYPLHTFNSLGGFLLATHHSFPTSHTLSSSPSYSSSYHLQFRQSSSHWDPRQIQLHFLQLGSHWDPRQLQVHLRRLRYKWDPGDLARHHGQYPDIRQLSRLLTISVRLWHRRYDKMH